MTGLSGKGPFYDGDPRKIARWWKGPGTPPRIVVWEITLKCDLGCCHCGSRAGRARMDELSTAEALDTVAQLANLGVHEVTLIGGEAYLREDWAEIACAITDSGMTCTMVTGGHGFDDWRLEQAIAAGIRHISVSIDGLGATHDTLRGRPGSFDAAVDCSRRIARTRAIGLGINTQINRLSMPELDPLADLLVEIGARAWQIQLTVPLGRAADRPHLLLQPFHLLNLFPMLDRIKREKLDPSGVQLFPGNNIGYFGPYEAVLRYGGQVGRVWNGCKAGCASLGLEADGKVKGCPSLPSKDYTGGNVRQLSIEEIWRTKAELRWLGERTVANLWGFCADCAHAEQCKAGCSWTSHALFGRTGNNPYCHHRALALQAQGLRERLQLVDVAPGEPFDYGRFELITESFVEDEEKDELSPVVMTELVQLFNIQADRKSVWSEKALKQIVRTEAGAKTAAVPLTEGKNHVPEH